MLIGFVQEGLARSLRFVSLRLRSDVLARLTPDLEDVPGKLRLAAEVGTQRAGHGHEALHEGREHEPCASLRPDLVSDTAQTRSRQEGQEGHKCLLVRLHEVVRSCAKRVKVARNRNTELRDVAGLETAPAMSVLVTQCCRF